LDVLDGLQLVQRGPADASRRRAGSIEVEGLLEVDEALEQLVVGLVGDEGVVERVVAVVVVVDRFAQLVGLLAGLVLGQLVEGREPELGVLDVGVVGRRGSAGLSRRADARAPPGRAAC
jgi:hypothetical protein